MKNYTYCPMKRFENITQIKPIILFIHTNYRTKLK